LDAGILAELQRRYAEPHRSWHRWPRVAEMLEQAEDVAGAIADRPAFILAVLFHRAVFDRRMADGAARSIALMQELASGTPRSRLTRAAALIQALARQDLPETGDPSLRGDASLLLDMDRAVLGAPEAEFDAYEAAFRREFTHLGDDAYAAGRSGALQMLLWRERIYFTDRYFLERERHARGNVTRLLRRLIG
jgi:predicted metal-dependent HD superfamily phosphohydrolase